jgi:ribonuclease D
VAKMAGIVLGIRISKSQQLSNWDAEVLSGAQLLYAATDAWVCYRIYAELQKFRSR